MNTTRTSFGSYSTQGASAPCPARPDFSYERIYKLPRVARYFNVSVLWIAYYPHLTRLLYALRVRHEIVTLTSLVCGLSAAAILVSGRTTAMMIFCALLIHLKDAFDACDGSLARLTGTGHRIGRFLDTIGDGLVFTALIAAIARSTIHGGGSLAGTIIWAAAAWLSLFLQCSYFNYYHLRYTRLVGATSVSRLDEHSVDEADREYQSRLGRSLQSLLHGVYVVWFGWQDRLIQGLDRLSRSVVQGNGVTDVQDSERWYGARGFLVANSALCYGTHAFVLILCVLARRPAWFFPAVAIVMNLYFAAILVLRLILFREETR